MKPQEEQKKKRTQRDYNLGFKLAVISHRSTVLNWLRKFGDLYCKKPNVHFMSSPKLKETPAQKIKRLEKELEEQRLK